MNNSLFPVKLAGLLMHVMADEKLMSRTCNHLIEPAMPNEYHRIVLCSPNVQHAVRNRIGKNDFRVRLAIPKESHSPMDRARSTNIEVYSVKGKLLTDANVLSHIERDLSLAIELELIYALLETKGIKVDHV